MADQHLLVQPPLHFQVINLFKVGILICYNQIVFQSNRCNPQIILRYGTSFEAQNILDLSIPSSCSDIAAQNHTLRYQFVYLCDVLSAALRFSCPIVKLSNRNAGNENFARLRQLLFDQCLIGEQGNQDAGIQEVSTTHWCLPVRILALWLLALTQRRCEKLSRQTATIVFLPRRAAQKWLEHERIPELDAVSRRVSIAIVLSPFLQFDYSSVHPSSAY